MASKRLQKMELPQTPTDSSAFPLLALPDSALVSILRNLDGTSLVNIEQTARYFTRRDPVSRLPLCEHVARELVFQACGNDADTANRFRHRSWKERLHLECSTGAGFDRSWCEQAGFRFQFDQAATQMQSVRLTGMGPKLLLSDVSTRDQPVLRWRLRVRGNTAVEFGVVPVALTPEHTTLHKCMAAPGSPRERSMGFCSQITAGSLLPLKAPVMRGTIVDIVAQRGRVEVVLQYPPDAKEINWQGGQPVQRSYRGPAQLRFEQDFPDTYDVRLAVTSWAKASFDVLHAGFEVHPLWAVPCAAEEEPASAAAAAPAAPAALADAAAEAPATCSGQLGFELHTSARAVSLPLLQECQPTADLAGSLPDPAPLGLPELSPDVTAEKPVHSPFAAHAIQALCPPSPPSSSAPPSPFTFTSTLSAALAGRAHSTDCLHTEASHAALFQDGQVAPGSRSP